jgi:hypothetical protein
MQTQNTVSQSAILTLWLYNKDYSPVDAKPSSRPRKIKGLNNPQLVEEVERWQAGGMKGKLRAVFKSPSGNNSIQIAPLCAWLRQQGYEFEKGNDDPNRDLIGFFVMLKSEFDDESW